MGRQDLFPLLVFSIILVAALAGILAINTAISPGSLSRQNLIGHTSILIPPPDPLLFAPEDDPFTEEVFSYLQAGGTTSSLSVQVLTEPGVQQFVHQKGYYYDGSAWKDFTFPNTTAGTSKWISGGASISISTALTGGSTPSVLVYVCRRYEGTAQYVCGPKGDEINYSIRNWTATAIYIAPEPVTMYSCVGTRVFCGAANTSPLTPGQNMTIFTPLIGGMLSGVNYQLCQNPAHSCYQCNEGYTNTSDGKCVAVPGCTATSDCASNEVCQNSQCVAQPPSCSDPCTGTGSRCTADGKVQTCVSSCWNTPQNCGSTQTCSSGSCLDNCASPNFCASNPLGATVASGHCSTGSCYSCPTGMAFNAQANACQSSCTPAASQCTYASACATAGTDNCGNANAAICSRNTQGNACTANGQAGTCQGGTCQASCTPLTKAQACGTKQCGTASNGCGGTVSCGSNNGACQSGYTCDAQQQCVQNAVCTNDNTKCQQDGLWFREYRCNNGQWAVERYCDTGSCSADGKTCSTCTPSKTCTDYPGQCGTGFSDGCSNTLSCGCSGTCSVTSGQGTCQTSTGQQNLKILNIQTVITEEFGQQKHAIAVTYCKEKDEAVSGLNLVIKSHISEGGPTNGVNSDIRLCSDPNRHLSNTTYEYRYLFNPSQGGQATAVQAYFEGLAHTNDPNKADNTMTKTITLGSCSNVNMCN